MKNLLIISALSVFALVACNTTEGPESVATKFLTELNKANFDGASAYGTANTKQMMDMFKMFAGDEKPAEAPAFTITNVSEDGDNAKVTYKTEGLDTEETIDLVKENGKWLVDMHKEDPGLGDWDGDDEDFDWDEESDWDEEGDGEGDEDLEETEE